MGTWRFTQVTATRAVWNGFKYRALPLAILLLAFVAVDLQGSSRRGPVERLFKEIESTVNLVITCAVLGALQVGFLTSSEWKLTPDAFTRGATTIPRDQVHRIRVTSLSATVISASPARKIAISSELDGYPEFLQALRAWTPPSAEWTTAAPSRGWPPVLVILAAYLAFHFRHLFLPLT